MPNSSLTRQELLDAIKELKPVPSYEDEPAMNGPVHKPIDKYSQLPETTRDWLEGLRPDDTKEIDDVRRWFRNSKIITAFGRWLVVAMVAVFLATGQATELFFKIISRITGTP